MFKQIVNSKWNSCVAPDIMFRSFDVENFCKSTVYYAFQGWLQAEQLVSVCNPDGKMGKTMCPALGI